MKIRARGSILRMKWKTAYLAPDKAEDERARLQYPARWYIYHWMLSLALFKM
jgi:hypothetical protein